jgi:hypothetical protein
VSILKPGRLLINMRKSVIIIRLKINPHPVQSKGMYYNESRIEEQEVAYV